MKQTAVEWLVETLAEKGVLHSSDICFAKNLEQEYIMVAHYYGLINLKKHNTIPIYCTFNEEVLRFGIDYYNETFKK